MQDRKRVLVLDDDASLLRSLERLLRLHSFEPVLFSSAEDFAARADFADACCILLDINLKKGSGIELRDRLAKAGISTPVIFMTGNTDERTRSAFPWFESYQAASASLYDQVWMTGWRFTSSIPAICAL